MLRINVTQRGAIRSRLDVDATQRVLERAMLRAGRVVQRVWISQASEQGAPQKYVDGVSRADSVELRSSLRVGTRVAVTVAVVNRFKGASRVDNGREGYHLPSVINWPTPRTKIGKNGKMWLDIPFRHKVASMPKGVRKAARQLAFTVPVGHGLVYAEDGRYLQADYYRVEGEGERRLAHSIGGDRFRGLLRGRKGKATRYLTIRRMTPDSPGWNIPEKKGLDLPKKIAAGAASTLRVLVETEMRVARE